MKPKTRFYWDLGKDGKILRKGFYIWGISICMTIFGASYRLMPNELFNRKAEAEERVRELSEKMKLHRDYFKIKKLFIKDGGRRNGNKKKDEKTN